jgi:hypothetical protein
MHRYEGKGRQMKDNPRDLIEEAAKNLHGVKPPECSVREDETHVSIGLGMVSPAFGPRLKTVATVETP